jgi:two-component system, sensor histidine kinase and response regulator
MEITGYKELNTETTLSPGYVLKILIVEDNPGDVAIIREFLKLSGISFNLTHTSNVSQTLAIKNKNDFDIVLLDLGLPDSVGLETLNTLQVHKLESPIIVMTGLDDESTALSSLREGAQDYLLKNSLTSDMLIRSIKYSIERKKFNDILKKHTYQFSILSTAVSSISQCENIASIYVVVCESIRLLLNNSKAIALHLDDDTLSILCSEWLKPWSKEIKNQSGIDLDSPQINIKQWEKEIFNIFSENKLNEVKFPLSNMFNKNDVNEIFKKLKDKTGFNLLYAIGYIKGTQTYGGTLIFAEERITNDDSNIIETLCQHASLSIHRKSIENELRDSELKYKKLNRQLEKKVRERTKDIEQTNLLLNKELEERKSAQEALKKSESQLLELNATKDKFFNIVAHDLKNPFTSLIGSSELLIDNISLMDRDKIQSLALILNDSAKYGYSILLNLLDWSRSQTGLLKFTPEEINLGNLINENISNLQPFAANKSISIFSEVKNNINLYTDKCMINSILRNLIGNAIKFTHKNGKVVVSAKIEKDYIHVSIKDNGKGIMEKNIKKLFRIDSKYSTPGTDNELGTGIGLKLCKEITGRLGGEIWVQSTENIGSVFTFSIPSCNKTD